jgi:tetratricopeptide (TPR) repeat protein
VRLWPDSPGRHRTRLLVLPVAIGALALLSTACGSASSTGTSTTDPTRFATPEAALTAGLAAQDAGHIALATADYKAAVAKAPTSTTASYANYDLGDLAQIDEKDPSAAETYYRAALATDPRLVNAIYNLAIVLTPSSPRAAEGEYLQAIALDPGDSDAHLNLAFLYLSQGDATAAHKEFADATSLDPSLASRIPASAKS